MAPATVSLTGGLTDMAGTFTLPASPVYDTLSYRLVPAAGGVAVIGWTPLSAQQIAAGTFSIPGTFVTTGLYHLEMKAATSRGEESSGGWPCMGSGCMCSGCCG